MVTGRRILLAVLVMALPALGCAGDRPVEPPASAQLSNSNCAMRGIRFW